MSTEGLPLLEFDSVNELLEEVTYHQYRVREDGAVFNQDGKKLKPNFVINRNGRRYPKYHLYINGVREVWFAHRLMAYLFFGPFDEADAFKQMVVDHIDNDSLNYSIWNLEILTNSGNLRRRRDEFSDIPF